MLNYERVLLNILNDKTTEISWHHPIPPAAASSWCRKNWQKFRDGLIIVPIFNQWMCMCLKQYIRITNIYIYIYIYIYPICSMYGIFTYIWVMFRANVAKYSIHGAYGYIYIYTHTYLLYSIPLRNTI